MQWDMYDGRLRAQIQDQIQSQLMKTLDPDPPFACFKIQKYRQVKLCSVILLYFFYLTLIKIIRYCREKNVAYFLLSDSDLYIFPYTIVFEKCRYESTALKSTLEFIA